MAGSSPGGANKSAGNQISISCFPMTVSMRAGLVDLGRRQGRESRLSSGPRRAGGGRHFDPSITEVFLTLESELGGRRFS